MNYKIKIKLTIKGYGMLQYITMIDALGGLVRVITES